MKDRSYDPSHHERTLFTTELHLAPSVQSRQSSQVIQSSHPVNHFILEWLTDENHPLTNYTQMLCLYHWARVHTLIITSHVTGFMFAVGTFYYQLCRRRTYVFFLFFNETLAHNGLLMSISFKRMPLGTLLTLGGTSSSPFGFLTGIKTLYYLGHINSKLNGTITFRNSMCLYFYLELTVLKKHCKFNSTMFYCCYY